MNIHNYKCKKKVSIHLKWLHSEWLYLLWYTVGSLAKGSSVDFGPHTHANYSIGIVATPHN